MEWNQIVDVVKPYIVKIETPMGHGTGFLFFYNEERSVLGIATALHVVSYAHEWRQPIRLEHHPSSKTLFVNSDQRAIFVGRPTDSAVILVRPGILGLPDKALELLPSSTSLEIGSQVGWLGFPALAPSTLCFFQGSISAKHEPHSYLIDGVAINGVSGGPVFIGDFENGVQIVGIVSAYFPNMATGDTLPGLLIARDVSHFHESIQHIRSFDEATKKAAEIKQKQEQSPETLPTTPSTPPAQQSAAPAQASLRQRAAKKPI